MGVVAHYLPLCVRGFLKTITILRGHILLLLLLLRRDIDMHSIPKKSVHAFVSPLCCMCINVLSCFVVVRMFSFRLSCCTI